MSLPDVTAQRRYLTERLGQAVGLPVYTAVNGTLPKEFIVLGMPSWDPPTESVCMHVVEWQVMVCVGRSGSNDLATALALESLWPRVLGALDELIEADQTMGGTCMSAHLADAYFTPVTLQGADYPAQIITIKMQGV